MQRSDGTDPRRSPRPSDEQTFPEPERPLNTQEEAGESMQELRDPPQAEGDREPDAPPGRD